MCVNTGAGPPEQLLDRTARNALIAHEPASRRRQLQQPHDPLPARKECMVFIRVTDIDTGYLSGQTYLVRKSTY
jgi:hypothetical protein